MDREVTLQQVEIQRDHAIGAAQLGADHALFGRAVHLLDAHGGAARGCRAGGVIGERRGCVRVAMIVVIVAVIVCVAGSVHCDRRLVAAATPASGGFRLGGVVVDSQSGGEIGFHALHSKP
ncbi:hypothetical protein GCM10009079_23580 [Ralstonia mannitolilytica]